MSHITKMAGGLQTRRPSHRFHLIHFAWQSRSNGTLRQTVDYFAEPDEDDPDPVFGVDLTSGPQPTTNRHTNNRHATNFFIAKLLRNCELPFVHNRRTMRSV